MKSLSNKLGKKAFEISSKDKFSESNGKSKGSVSFSSLLDEAQGNKSVSEVVKSLSSDLDLLQGPKEINAIQSESIKGLDLSSNMPGEDQKGSKVMSHITSIMGEVNDGQNKMQKLMDLITSGQKISPHELIAIQAGIFSLVQELEMASKGTQELTQSVRQILNTNLG